MRKKEKERLKKSLKYFFKMGREERVCVEQWFKTIPQDTESFFQKVMMEILENAISSINYDYYIATIEPSLARGKLYYNEGEPVAIGMNGVLWRMKAEAFAPQYNSRLANIYELILWYAYRCAKGYWSLSYMCNDSSDAGNYRNSPDSTGNWNVSGAQEVGGFKDGIGNTTKIVIKDETIFYTVGGAFMQSGYSHPVTSKSRHNWSEHVLCNGVGIIVLLNMDS